MRKIQKQIDDWVVQYKIGYWTPHEMLARLTEEVGELAREINHQYGPKKKKEGELQKEIGDDPVPNRGRETTNKISTTKINITNNIIGYCTSGARALFGTG